MTKPPTYAPVDRIECRMCGTWTCDDCGWQRKRASLDFANHHCHKCGSTRGTLVAALHTQKVGEDHHADWLDRQKEDIYCSHLGCDAHVKNDYWRKVKSGWFFQRNGDSWCPKHFPDWVEEWRASQRDKS